MSVPLFCPAPQKAFTPTCQSNIRLRARLGKSRYIRGFFPTSTQKLSLRSQIRNFLSRKHGFPCRDGPKGLDGTYLSTSAEAILNEPLDFLVLLDDLSHHELFETRLIVEPELAARAADRATTEDLHALRAAVTAMQDSSGTEARLLADMAFHDAVFRASGNRICQLLFKRIHRTLLTSMSHLSGRVGIEQPLSYHKKIYAAIRAHDAEDARRLMREHILDARSLLTQDKTKSKRAG